MSHILAEKDEDRSLICCLVRSVAFLSGCDRSVVNNDRMVTNGRELTNPGGKYSPKPIHPL
jgi:hypothetical protein